MTAPLRVTGYKCRVCLRPCYVEATEEAYVCPSCRNGALDEMTGPFRVVEGAAVLEARAPQQHVRDMDTPKRHCGCEVYEVCPQCEPETHARLIREATEQDATREKARAPEPQDCRCGHLKGRHQITNLGNVTRCSDCGCERFEARAPEDVDFDWCDHVLDLTQQILDEHNLNGVPQLRIVRDTLRKLASRATRPAGGPAMSDLNTILADMQAASDAADETSEPTDYTMRLVALALIARHYLRVLASQSAPREAERRVNLGDLAWIIPQRMRATPPEPPAPCVCHVEDGLVQEWVSKARAVAKSKGFKVAEPPAPCILGVDWGSGEPPAQPKCRVCLDSGFVAKKRTIDDGYGEVDTCPACDGTEPPAGGPAMSDDPIVGHKTYHDGHHEPLRQSEAAALMAAADEAKARRAEQMPDERSAINAMFEAWLRLNELGWREAQYCPKDGSLFDAIEAGSTGIHRCRYEGQWPTGHWWVVGDDDLYPSRPVLFRVPTPQEPQGQPEGK